MLGLNHIRFVMISPVFGEFDRNSLMEVKSSVMNSGSLVLAKNTAR